MTNTTFLFSSALALLAVSAQADLLHLNDGGHLRAEVTGYAGNAYQLTLTGGVTTNLAGVAVRGVDFEHGHVTAKLQTITGGTLTGEVWLVDKQQLHLEDGTGTTRRIAVADVASATFTYVPVPEKPRPVVVKRVLPPEPIPTRRRATTSPDIAVITNGERINIVQNLARGKVTLVDFYAPWCGPCRQLAPILENIAREDDQVAIRKVDIVRWGSPVADQYQITSIPRVQIYDVDGHLVRSLAGFHERELLDAIEIAKAVRAP
jgi:thioredoxin 1